MDPRQKSARLQGPARKSETIPRKEQIEIENDESKSRLQMKLAKDKLLVYGMNEKEIQESEHEDGVQKARMILRSRADGIVIKRTVVQGNYYDAKDELMEIAPLDHLLVRRQRQRARRRQGRGRPDPPRHLPLLRSNDPGPGRVHRQGHRS